MEDLEEDLKNFHDSIIFENTQLKAKLEALEKLVKTSIFLLFDTVNYNQLIKESILKEAESFDEISSSKEVYNARLTSDERRLYLLKLRQELEKVK